MVGFGMGKKKEAFTPEPPQDNTPTQEVLRLRQQGLSNNQIVQSLQRSGYKTHQIFDAMNQADMKSAAAIEPPAIEGANVEPATRFSSNDVIQDPYAAPQEQVQQFQSSPPPQYDEATEDRIEEIAESIIDEKWQDLIKNVNKIVEWKNVIESKIVSLEEQNDALKKEFEKLYKALFDRMDGYDKNIGQVGTNLKAMEQVFTKILPTLSTNVNELSRITKGMKAKKQQTK
ncbi:hypothetical protein JXB11_00600 [Candidatus Woesearchaeota archaeon]|nr:hypothetical protein [Candidatus Woesearchaeota archaeon]